MKNPYELINPSAEFLSIKEIGKLFSPPISYQSLWKWQKQGILKLTPYQLGNKKFYKRTEVMEVLEEFMIPQATQNN